MSDEDTLELCSCGSELQHFEGAGAAGWLCPKCDHEHAAELTKIAAHLLEQHGPRAVLLERLQQSAGLVRAIAMHGPCDQCGGPLVHHTSPNTGAVLCPVCDGDELRELGLQPLFPWQEGFEALRWGALLAGVELELPPPVCSSCHQPCARPPDETRSFLCSRCRGVNAPLRQSRG